MGAKSSALKPSFLRSMEWWFLRCAVLKTAIVQAATAKRFACEGFSKNKRLSI
jgi:hypothetical protein